MTHASARLTDTPDHPRREIAIVGGGIAGLAAAWHLRDTDRVTLYEAAPRLGGHARTVLAGKRGDQPVDTGFIVYNDANYPHLTALFAALEVPVVDSDMSFGASFDGGRMEYGLAGLRAVLAQPWRVGDPRYLGMLRDILRFNARAEAVADDPAMTVGDLLDRLGTGAWFRDRYLLPLSGAIWSTPAIGIAGFPAQSLLRFFRNHALLGITGQHQWRTVQGGSVEYVRRMQAALKRAGVNLCIGAPVRGISRGADGVTVQVDGQPARYDAVIMATHSDDSLALLTDADADERAALGAVRYQDNYAVLHADPSVMPRRRAVWSSWNYTEAQGGGEGIDLTYWMNRLQPIPPDDPLFVTLNARRPIRADLVYDRVTFRHPVYDLAAERGRAGIRALNGRRATWFCGAWMRNGFHEDGFASAVEVVEGLRAAAARPLAAE